MKENCWSKTLLGVYNYLETIAGAIDKITMKTALNSFKFSKNNYEKNNVYNISNKLIDLSERKITLINLKILIEECLKNLAKSDALILIARYINKQKIGDIALKHSLSNRTIFRKLNTAEGKFMNALIRLGYNTLRLKNMLKNEHWILNYYESLASKNGKEDFVLENVSLEKVVAL